MWRRYVPPTRRYVVNSTLHSLNIPEERNPPLEHWGNLKPRITEHLIALPTYCRVQDDGKRPSTAVSPSVCEIKTEVLRENRRALEASFAHADSAVVDLYHSSPGTHPRTVQCGAPGELNSPISLQCAAINRSQCWPSPKRMTSRFWSLPDMYWVVGAIYVVCWQRP